MPISSKTLPVAAEDLHLTLRLELRLHRSGPHAQWCADLSLPGQAPQLSFPSLPALIGYIARLDRPVPAGGIR